MPDSIDISKDLLSLPALIDALGLDPWPAERRRRLAQLRRSQRRSRKAVQQQADDLQSLYQAALREDADPGELTRTIEVLLEKERAQAERLVPGIESLRQTLAARGERVDPELRRTFEESLEIAELSLAIYRIVREKLLELAADRRGDAGGVLRAKPAVGDIDHSALSREFMARFPKIRATLAK